VDSKGFSVQPHEVWHRDVINRTGVAEVFLGDLVLPPRGGKMLSSGRELGNKNNSSVLVKIKSLGGKVDDDSRASLDPESTETG